MIVSHGGINRILLAHALQMPDRCLFRLDQGYAAVNLLSFIEDTPLVQLVNHSTATVTWDYLRPAIVP
jgi:alpha-ribazole phosphatase/probable phosphoglycerate mutase